MEAIISVTINLPVSFTATHDGVVDMLIDGDLAIDLINTELETKESENALMSEAEEVGTQWEADRAEFIVRERRDVR